MNEHLILAELEASANTILSPTIQSPETRQAAENIFINFQKTESPFQLCKFILESSQNDYVLFQTATLLKKAVIREWNQFTPEEKASFQSYILQFVTHHPKAASYVREQLLLVLAIVVKRASLDSGPPEASSLVTDAVLAEVCKLISSGNSDMQVIGCSFILALLAEFSTTTQTTDVGLPWETHLNAKKHFEKNDLKKIFHYCLQGLDELNKLGNNFSKEAAYIMKKFLMIAEQILSWNFQFPLHLPRRLMGLFESQQCPTFRPPIDWQSLVLDPQVLQLFFKLHSQCRRAPELSHHTLQCLFQLASLSGVVLTQKEDRLAYLHRFVLGLLQLGTSGELASHEVLGVSNIVNRLGVFFPSTFLCSLPSEDVEHYLEWLTRTTKCVAQLAVQEELTSAGKEERIHNEALDHFLSTWALLVQDSSSLPLELVKRCAADLFACYLQSHLAPPDGTRPLMAAEEEEVDELEEDDRTKFKDQLLVIGDLSRLVLDYTVPLLSSLLEARVKLFQSTLQQLQATGGKLSATDQRALTNLHEDLHWIVMLSGHLLVPAEGGPDGSELGMIPREVIYYCISRQDAGMHSKEATVHLLSSLDQPPEATPHYDTHADPIVRLVSAVFRLCEVEKRALEAGLVHRLSPEVASTLASFLRSWVPAYLMPTETYYAQLSLSLTEAFGQDSPSAAWVLKWAVGKLESNLLLWGAEPKLCCDTALALKALLSPERAAVAMNEGYLAPLLTHVHSAQFQQLPSQAKRHLLRGLVATVGTRDPFWEGLMSPFHAAFNKLVDSLSSTTLTSEQRDQLCDLLESFAGMAEACTLPTLPRLFPALLPVAQRLPRVLDVCHNYTAIVALIFRYFSILIERTLCYLNPEDSAKLYQCCLEMMEMYARHKKGQVSVEPLAEEEQYEDILVLMQLLTDVLSKDILDMVVANGNTGNNTVMTSPGDVALYGLMILLPLMSEGLLRFPRLCSNYYKLVTFMAEVSPAKLIAKLSALPALLGSVHLGLTQFGTEVVSLCLDFLTVMGTYLYHHKYREDENQGEDAMEKENVRSQFRPFLRLVLELVLYQPLEGETIHNASAAVFTLICCFSTAYQALVSQMISAVANPRHAQRLASGFQTLTTGLGPPFSLDRINRTRFKDRFEAFVLEARGFLYLM